MNINSREFLFRLRATGDNQIVDLYGNSFGKESDGDGDYGYVVLTFAIPGQFYIQNCGGYVSVPNHTWHHIALTRKGKHVTFRLDGKLSSSYDYFRADALIRDVPFTIAINSSYTQSRFSTVPSSTEH